MARFKVARPLLLYHGHRINSDIRGAQFMDDDDLEEVKQWIDNLKSPAFLAVGQPLLAKENAIRSLLDKGLLSGLKPFLSKGLLVALDVYQAI
jgi:hypothetical protein